MKTLILQGEQRKFEYLYKDITLEDKDKDLIPYEVEIRVYVIDIFTLEEQYWNDLTDDEFMTLAEEQGNIYTLQGFQEAFNSQDINTEIDAIRFISVPIH